MTDQELIEDFIGFVRKQLHYGSSKMPLLEAMLGDYTYYPAEVEKITAGLQRMNAIKYHGGNAVIDLEKILV